MVQPIKKIKIDVSDVEEEMDPLEEAQTLPEMLLAAYTQEIDAKYLSVIETLILKMQSEETQRVWMYGVKTISDRIVEVVSNATAMSVEPFRRRTIYDARNIYLFDLYSATPCTVRSSLYRILEKTNPMDIIGSKMIIQIPTIADAAKLDRRIISRMDGLKVFIREIEEEGYYKMFSRVVEKMGSLLSAFQENPEESENEEKESMLLKNIKKIENMPFPSHNSQKILDGLRGMTSYAYSIDSSYEAMSLYFYRYIYSIPNVDLYAGLNSVHLILLLIGTIKRITLVSCYEEFERRTSSIFHFKSLSRDIIYRRHADLVELGLLTRGYFMSDRADLEREVQRREEVYLKVFLEKVKRHWK
ncbi:hypothetical protein NEFER03_2126 [Nematocida sp. LUAm3]|nr:hypothetical protein NEFER03_2126 [Nematocida sp. LUAm3]KAI5175622.1 hypothetical protein NEFER02_1509 [Nematocida sp. LUAm2]KAI5178528.1 hypothetical protein NEFER01_1664 [Nematocida sp. LUAm1]